jgi:transcriptional regulator with XRE-family HTH domain
LITLVLGKKELGKLIKQARKIHSDRIDKKYTQKMLANDIGKSQSYIGDIESGRTYPSFITLNEIANACHIPISYFQDDQKINEDIDKFIKLQLTDLEDGEVHKIRESN